MQFKMSSALYSMQAWTGTFTLWGVEGIGEQSLVTKILAFLFVRPRSSDLKGQGEWTGNRVCVSLHSWPLLQSSVDYDYFPDYLWSRPPSAGPLEG